MGLFGLAEIVAGEVFARPLGAVAPPPTVRALSASELSDLEQSLADEVAAYGAADRVAPPAACQVLFVGSSSIVHWKDTLAADMAPLPVINRGFGNSQIVYVNRWFAQLVAPHRPRAIVFYAGENDLHYGRPVRRVVADFDKFMALKDQALGATPVYFISIKPSKARFDELALQTQVNDAIHSRVGRRQDLHYLDVVGAMLDRGRPRELFGPDDLHMNRAGYELWTRIVRKALLADDAAARQRCLSRTR